MPIELKPPRGKSPNWTIRGTYLGVYVDRTTGTADEALAKKILRKEIRDIERGRASPAVAPEAKAEKTFADAALSYIKAGGEARYIGTFDPKRGIWTGGVISHLIDQPLSAIDQQMIDDCAVALYPTASAMTRNRHVYTPVSAVLKHAGVDFKVRRPKGWRGRTRIDWLTPDQAHRMLDAALEIDREFSVFLAFLLYTGCRLNEGLSLTCDRLNLAEAFAYFPKTKNDDPRMAHLPPFLVVEMANHPRGLDRGKQKTFRFRKCGRLYTLLGKVKAAAGPDVGFATFHTFCHTWATWMRRYGGSDTKGLISTGRWRDEKSASRYEHVVVSEEAKRADLLPVPQRKKKRRSVEKTWTPKIVKASG